MKRMKLIRVNSTHRKKSSSNDLVESNSRNKKVGLKTDEPETTWLHLLITTVNQNRRIIRNATVLTTTLLLLLAITILVKKLTFQQEKYEEAFYGDKLGNHSVFYRKKWGGPPPITPPAKLQPPVPLVIISHSQTRPCGDLESCSEQLQKLHQQRCQAQDMGCNFAIGGDSNIYVGRGWDVENTHGRNSIGIDFIGDFNYDYATGEMADAARVLILQGLQLRKIAEGYVLVGENQTNPRRFISPGEYLYDVIKRWPHFYNKTMF